MPRSYHQFAAPSALPQAEIAQKFVRNGIETYFEIYGSAAGVPLVLLHGGSLSLLDWGNQISAFSESRRVIAIETRGHGRNCFGGDLHFADFAQDAAYILHHLQIGQADVLGWSDGGVTGLYLAMMRPQRLRKLITFGSHWHTDGLISPVADNPCWPQVFEYLAANSLKLSGSTNAFGRREEALNAMYSREPRFKPADLRAIAPELLVLQAEHDEFVKLSHARELAAFVPHARFELLKAAGHCAPWQDAARFNDAVMKFLDGA